MNTGDALGTGSVAQRIAHVILLQAEVHGSTTGDGLRVLTHMSHRDIATLVGASRQWVTTAWPTCNVASSSASGTAGSPCSTRTASSSWLGSEMTTT